MAEPHCECCGKVNPEMEDGYTTCCHELICFGDERNKFGVPDDFVVACCWAKAELKFKSAGKVVPEGSYRLD